MAAVGLAEETQSAILRLVSAVLWLGNVAFAASGSGEVGPRDAAAREALEHAASLLGVDVATLTKSLTHRTISTGLGERITSPLAAEECAATRDALARALYARGFDHLVLLLNQCIAPGGPSSASIGILDIYGFEVTSPSASIAASPRPSPAHAAAALPSRAGVREQLVRAAVHQLCQREAAAVLHLAHPARGAGGVRSRGDRVPRSRASSRLESSARGVMGWSAE